MLSNVDVEATNVLSDIITCLSVNESVNLDCSVKVEPKNITEHDGDIGKDSASENSVSEDTDNYKKDGSRVSFLIHCAIYAK